MGVFQITSKVEFFVLAALFVLTCAKHEDYVGWKSYYIHTSTTEQVKKLNDIRIKMDLDFLSPALVKREAVVLVKPEQHEEFIKSLDQLGIKYKIHVDDVKLALDHDDEKNKNRTKDIARGGGDIMSYDDYQRLETIYAYMAYIAAEYPKTTTLVTAANTFEGRPIRYMKISTTNFKDKTKPVIFIEAGIHAREWLAPPMATWAIMKLTENVTEPNLLNDFDWILMPVANPDGYYFTFNGKRLWRKNRSMNYPNDLFCPGVDGNRNFNIAWNVVDNILNPCSGSYSGTKPFSEVETQVIRNILMEHLPRIALFLSMHSFGSLIMHSWGHNDTLSYNYDNLTSVGYAMADAFHERGPANFPPYYVGSTADLLYLCSGNSVDYAHHIGVPLAYTIELPGFSPHDRDRDGFDLDPRHIKGICRGTWAGIVVGAKKAKELFRV
ncbi:hypothetical protein PYW07_006266 [Mythimna separata]|uniref:Peptidase M14 domain-containing protein n=1 Tax=Mythimna separata TaxID=271217 RepID=A0AAD8DWD6_MYTSE|nr:hypothetical protein PYW07_006266 [Mythimna separata]